MTVRSPKFNGNPWADGDILFAADLVDTFDETAFPRTVVGHKMQQYFDLDSNTSVQDKNFFVNGSVVGAPAQKIINGFSGLNFNGTDEYMTTLATIDSTASLGLAIETFVQIGDVGTLQRIAALIDTSTRDLVISFSGANVVTALVRTPDESVTLSASTVFASGDNIHIVVNWQSEGIYELYINGVIEASATSAGAGQNYIEHLYVGALNNNGTAQDFFGGTIAKAVVYNKPLSPGEVAFQFNGGSLQSFE